MAAKGREMLVVQPEVGKDRWGDPLPGPAPASYQVAGCHVLPKYSREAETIVTGLRVLCNGSRDDLEAAQRIRGVDTISVRGEEWEVDGDVGVYVKNGRVVAVEIHLERVGVKSASG